MPSHVYGCGVYGRFVCVCVDNFAILFILIIPVLFVCCFRRDRKCIEVLFNSVYLPNNVEIELRAMNQKCTSENSM